jgi:hypothetical protein
MAKGEERALDGPADWRGPPEAAIINPDSIPDPACRRRRIARVTPTSDRRGPFATAAAWGSALGAALPLVFGLGIFVLNQRSRSPAPKVEATFLGYLGLVSLGGAAAGALAALYCVRMVGPSASPRALAAGAVIVMYAGALLGPSLVSLQAPHWFGMLSFPAGAIAAVLAFGLLARRW